MSTLAQPASMTETGEQRLLLHAVRWEQYLAIGEALRDRPGLRLTYDSGSLEVMTTSPKHEYYNRWIGRLIDALSEELGIPTVALGTMTFQRADLERGLEPDNCFWIAHEHAMRGRLEWDPDRDPPPDLVVEIEISRSALNRMDAYAKLRVPEVWRYDENNLTVHLLMPDGTYEAAERSRAFGAVSMQELAGFIEPSQDDTLTRIRAFRAWVREQLQ
jgi:Uma2 family endonuclease